ncbi:MAG: type 1 glutamine amidotransferase [Anaerolineae bacterium]|nr:type 1 glutamine amidotransferase [Anaerolineae bacterium]
MTKILAIQNCEIEGFGLYERHLAARGIDCQVVHAYQGHPLPALAGFDALFVGGTPISAYAAHQHPFLQDEIACLRQALDAGKPCLGICCGAQILAQLLGARVGRCEQMEIGGYRVRLTPQGQADPLLAGFPPRFPVFHWHGDTFGVPDGAGLLVEGESCPNQMFRRGNVVGVQFHLETTSQDVSAWADAYADELARVGKSKAQVIAECREQQPEMAVLAARLLDNYLESIVRMLVETQNP